MNRSIAEATKGSAVLADEDGALPLPAATQVATERHVAPVLPPSAWTLSAAVALGRIGFYEGGAAFRKEPVREVLDGSERENRVKGTRSTTLRRFIERK